MDSEKPAIRHPIRYESGMHYFMTSQVRDMRRRFLEGDLTASFWNKEIAVRTKQYHKLIAAPSVFGIDSLLPDEFTSNEMKLPSYLLPGFAADMAGKDHIYVVAGDAHYANLKEPVSGAASILDDENPVSYARMGVAEGLATIVAGTSLVAYAARFHNRIAPKEVSRRCFLRGIAGVAGSALLGVTLGRSTPLIESYSQNAEVSSLLQAVTEITRPWYANSKWLDARTAIVMGKTKEAMELLDLPDESVGTVIMGWPHSFEAGPLLRDKNVRMQVIRDHAKEGLANIDSALEVQEHRYRQLVEISGGDEDKVIMLRTTREDLQNAIVWNLALSEVFDVYNPDLSALSDPAEATENAIAHHGIFICKEVLDALEPLGIVTDDHTSMIDQLRTREEWLKLQANDRENDFQRD